MITEQVQCRFTDGRHRVCYVSIVGTARSTRTVGSTAGLATSGTRTGKTSSHRKMLARVTVNVDKLLAEYQQDICIESEQLA